ncbi:hypothetical protein EYF80_044395 [Liparis tanakae]|uniref:Uncharacterized protein n=1 Tax=Liparis tanakae TaxID=230148 RepID=A0A4Z2FVX0_9TELE|nr:hypothetical protein EYF80_044395 [Liparis tanakae]
MRPLRRGPDDVRAPTGGGPRNRKSSEAEVSVPKLTGLPVMVPVPSSMEEACRERATAAHGLITAEETRI